MIISENITAEVREQAAKVRKRMEQKEYILTEAEYETLLQYTARKCRLNGKGEAYIPVLLEDEIKDYYFRNTINSISFAVMALA